MHEIVAFAERIGARNKRCAEMLAIDRALRDERSRARDTLEVLDGPLTQITTVDCSTDQV